MTTDDPTLLAATLPLTPETVGLHADRLEVPVYDRTELTPSVVHIGVGGFHRAHQLVYFHELAQRGVSTEWGVVGVGLHSRRIKDALGPQDYLFTVVERGADGSRAKVVGAMGTYLYAPEERDCLLETLTAATTRLVTLTITGTAYSGDVAHADLAEEHPEVARDLQDPEHPSSVPGYLVEALRRRRDAGQAPFTVLSCDNMQHNGAAAREAVVSYALARDEELGRWIEHHVTFPSSMVDRITPETTPQERDDIADELGVDDRWPVITEPFSQWIVEDSFCNGRPPLDEVGVQFVDDVAPYELMKTRLLNASHSALGYLGYLAGHRTTDGAMADPVIREYVAGLLAEASPLLPEVPGVDLPAYQRTLVERFANPSISDGLDRLCRRGSTKVPNYLLPSLRQALAEQQPHALMTLAVAGWFRYLRGVDESGQQIEVQDAHAEQLTALAREGGADPRALLHGTPLLADLAQHEDFAVELGDALRRIDEVGTRAALAERLAPAVAA